MSTAQILALQNTDAPAPAAAGVQSGVRVVVWHRLADAEAAWRTLAGPVLESPGQDFDFVALWAASLGIDEADQYVVAAFDNGLPLALLPLRRQRRMGVRMLGWFPGAHVGCNAPLADGGKLARMSADDRRRLWQDMLAQIHGADLVRLKSVPRTQVDGVEIFAELGEVVEADTLYRAQFVSFEEADRTQRNKSRRKHDRQQGDKLAAMGPIEFDELDNGPQAEALLDVMFQQRAARFREMGVRDPFAECGVRAFYDATVRADSRVHVKLHVLRLKGQPVAMRYNIVVGDRLFCLISAMSEDERLRPGSPGKQCLLRVMQSVFAEGFRVFDMGEGLTDEKRHWCNVQIPVRDHYVPLTAAGAIAALAHRTSLRVKALIKSDPRLLAMAKALRGSLSASAGVAPAAEADG